MRLNLMIALGLTLLWRTGVADAKTSGVVLNHELQALPNARVVAFALAAPNRHSTQFATVNVLACTWTDQDGRFVIDAGRSPARLQVERDGYIPTSLLVGADEQLSGISLRRAAAARLLVRGDGAPLGNATVVLSGIDGIKLTLQTGIDGSVTVPDPDLWAATIAISHPEYAPRILAWRGGVATFDLDRGERLTGKGVAADAASSATGATVLVDGIVAGVVAAGGTFDLHHVPKSWRRIEVMNTDSIAAVTRDRAKSDAIVTARLERGGRVRGIVRSVADRAPVAGALIVLRRGTEPQAQELATTSDAEGQYKFAPLLPGRYSIDVQSPAFFSNTQTVSVAPGSDVDFTLDVEPKAIVRGRVVDGENRPVAGALLSVCESSECTSTSLVTDAAGEFNLRFAPSDEPVAIGVTTPAFAPSLSAALKLRPGDSRNALLIHLTRGIVLRGFVGDAQKKRIRDVVVRASASHQEAELRQETVSDENGGFALRVQPGYHDIVFSHGAFAPSQRQNYRLIKEGSPPLEVTLPGRAIVAGQIVHAGGEPAAGVTIQLISSLGEETFGEEIVTDENGRFAGSSLPRGIGLVLILSGLYHVTRTVAVPGASVRIELPALPSVSGRIVEKETGRPIPSFDVTFELAPETKTIDSEDGSFTLAAVPAGDATLIVSAIGHGSAFLHLAPASDDTIRLGDIPLERTRSFRGRVTGDDGDPIGGVSVAVEYPLEAPSFLPKTETTTNHDGKFSLDDFPKKSTTVRFEKAGFLISQREIEPADTEPPIEVQLSRGDTLRGVVVDAKGSPVEGASIGLVSALADSGSADATTGSSGAFEISGLAPGMYRLTAGHEKQGHASIEELEIPTSTPLRVELAPAGVITGRVEGVAPELFGQVDVIGALGATLFGRDGRFRITRNQNTDIGIVELYARLSQNGAELRTPEMTVDTRTSLKSDVTLTFAGTCTVRGRVRVDGKAAAGGRVTFTPADPSAQTSGYAAIRFDGRYEARGLSRGAYSVEWSHGDRISLPSGDYEVYPRAVSVDGSAVIDFELSRPKERVVDGHVMEAGSDRVLAGATVQIETADPDSKGTFYMSPSRSDARGYFRFSAVPDGTYDVTAEKDGYAPFVRRIVVTSEEPAGLQLTLTPVEGVLIHVFDGRTKRAVVPAIEATDASGTVVYNLYTPAVRHDGSVKLPLPDGSYLLAIHADLYAQAEQLIQVPSTPVRVPLYRGGKLVVQYSGTEPRTAQLLSIWEARILEELELEAPGATFEKVAPGSYMLRVVDEGGSDQWFPVTIVDSGTATVALP